MTSEPHEQRAGGDAGRAASLLDAVRDLTAEMRGGGTMPAVTLDTRLDTDLGLDSLSVAELLARVEQQFGIRLPDEVLATLVTARDLLDEVTAATDRAGHGPARSAPPAWADQPVAAGAAPAGAGTLVEVLARHAAEHADRPHLRLLTDAAEPDELSYGQLQRAALLVAGGLRQRGVAPGSTVALMLPTSRDYFASFLGILLAGGVPAPIYPPARPSGLEDHLHRHLRILDNAQAVALVTVPEARRLARLVAPRVPTLRHIVTAADLAEAGGAPARTTPAPGDTALLQYTSGSTGNPKGVVLSHANLLANIRAMVQAGEVTSQDVFVSWLPLYHDMGLIGSWLLSLYMGIPFVVMSPLAFLSRPERWLWAIHDHRGTLSGGPNFGYELVLRRLEKADLDGLDLSSWRIAFNGAEPVGPDTVVQFTERLARFGLSAGAVTPVYGLAECSVALTIPPPGRGPVVDRVAREPLARDGLAVPAPDDDPVPARFVACGRALPDHDVRIVDDHGVPLGERREGRIQFRGPSATPGYHRNPDATRRLVADGWLDSGDLGYLAGGELHVTGRVKDLIIRAGRNLHPAELEAAVGAVPGVRKGCVAAFAVSDPASGTERLVVIAETRADDEAERTRIRADTRRAAAEVVGTPPDEVVLAPHGAVPKTSSGKIRRAAARDRYERGVLAQGTRAVWLQVLRLAVPTATARILAAARAVTRGAYGVYALTVFVLLGAPTWIAVALLPGLRRRWLVVRVAARLMLRLTGVRLHVEGAERLPASPPYVVAANHASFLDPLVLALVLPEPAVFAAVGGLADNPLVHLFLRRMDAHLVERGDRVRGIADTDALTGEASRGRIVAFFPEGRRSPAPGLEPFRMGAFQVAVRAGAPVVPLALRGTREILPVNRALPRRQPITVTVEAPVAPASDGWPAAVGLQRAVRTAILRHCGEPDLS